MKSYVSEIDDASASALSAFVGQPLGRLCAPDGTVDLERGVLWSQQIVVYAFPEAKIILSADWDETEKEWIDLFPISARIESSSHFYMPNGRRGLHVPEKVKLDFRSGSRVARIDILSFGQVGDRERVTYDGGLLITREDGLRVAICRQGSISADVEIAWTNDGIAEIVAGSTCRRSFF
jgi:hypothetical protein